MEAPPLSTTSPIPTITTPAAAAYPDSVNSSPRSRQTDSGDADHPPSHPPPKLRLMCSYGGHIVPRPHDMALCYVGGDTRIIVVDRHTTLSDLHHRLSRSLLRNQPFTLKYQLPREELDSLISVTSDEDLENMVEEYDRLNSAAAAAGSKLDRLRLFIFPKSSSRDEQILVDTASAKSEDWFFNALNGKSSAISAAASDRGFSQSSSVNCLLGLDDDLVGKAAVVDSGCAAGIEGSKAGVNGNLIPNSNHIINQDVQSVPDSPMLRASSSFGSTSSSPSVANSPPIRVLLDGNPKVGGTGIEEQFQQMSIGVVNLPPPLKQQEAGIYMATGFAAGSVAVGTLAVVGDEYANRVISDDDRSDHGGYGKVQQFQPQVQAQLQPQQIPPFLQKQTNSFDLPSPDSVSSEGSVKHPLIRPRQAVYEEPFLQIQATNTNISSNHGQNKTLDENNTQAHTQPQLHQPQTFFHQGNQYISANAVPITSYYPIYRPHPQNHHQYPVYFVPSQTPYNQSRSVPSSKPEISTYRTPGPQLVQVTPGLAQPVGLGPIYQHSFGYEFVNQNNGPVYYEPLLPQVAAQYQTLMSAPGMGVPDASREVQP